MELFDYQSFHITTKFIKNRDIVVWCMKLKRSDADKHVNIEVAMCEKGHGWILHELSGDRQAKVNQGDAMDIDIKHEVPKTATLAPGFIVQPKRAIYLESMAFSQGSPLMLNKKIKLPDGSFKLTKKGYEEILIPAPKQKPVVDGELVPVTALPPWACEAFNVPKLNHVQSKAFPIAFGTDEPILLCAPTGSGKVCIYIIAFDQVSPFCQQTNVAMLTILNKLAKHRNEETSEFDLDAFKIIYIAPMKALVQEMVGNFSKHLKTFNVKVSELTGNAQMTKQHLSETQIIVTTPEKYDVVTRKMTETSYINLVRLIIVDEILVNTTAHNMSSDGSCLLVDVCHRYLRIGIYVVRNGSGDFERGF